jgi:CIC family chloride channel protein
MTSVLIIVEMTSGYSLILPLMIANMSAYVLARHWRPVPIYEALLAQDGVHLQDRAMLDGLDELRLGQLVRRRDDSFVVFEPATRAQALLDATGPGVRQVAFPVVDASRALVGVIYAEDLAVLRAEPELLPVVNAADLMRPALAVREDADLRGAFELMRDERLRELPVVDAEGHLVGANDEASIVDAFLRATAPSAAAAQARTSGVHSAGVAPEP